MRRYSVRKFALALLCLLCLTSAPFWTPTVYAQDDADDAGDAVSSLEAVQEAVVQIEAVGSFLEPGEGVRQNAAGSGSGFIIDPSGIAVTNNHVVTGAAFLRVYVAGEDEPLSARVLGVSECADLAVIDIRGRGDFPYLDWYDGPINVGLDVYAAGFPLGNPEFTLTRGIVAKAQASGQTPWASVDGVIQHDATINPGNSGGPLVDSDGGIVAVNFASNSNTSQYFAIGRDGALDLVERLREGNNVDSLGINGQAILFDDDPDDLFSGIWVSSVESGSPADDADIQAGDFILALEGITLAEDGTMASYCDILRSHEASDTLDIEIYRAATEELLVGQVNGRALEAQTGGNTSPAAQGDGDDGDGDDGDGDGDDSDNGSDDGDSGNDEAGYDEYVTLTDESGRLEIDVPSAWDDIDGSAWVNEDEEQIGFSLTATPNIDDFYSTFGTPGLYFGARDDLADSDPADYLDSFDLSNFCTYDERSDYDDGLYEGFYDFWTDCGEAESLFVAIAVQPKEGSLTDTLVYLEMVVVTDADLDALEKAVDSFYLLEPGAENTPDEAEREDESIDEESTEDESADGESTDESDADAPASDSTASGFVNVRDSFGMISIGLPEAWDDLTLSPWTYFSDVEEPVGLLLEASTDLEAFYDTWDTPGMLVAVSRTLVDQITVEEVLDNFDQSEECDYEGREPVENDLFTGFADTWTNCLEVGSTVIVYAGINEESNYLALVPVQIVEPSDEDDVFRALDSLTFGNPSVMDSMLRTGEEPDLLIDVEGDEIATEEDLSEEELDEEEPDEESTDESEGEESTDQSTDEESTGATPGDDLLGSTLVEDLDVAELAYDYEFSPNVAVNAVLPSDFADTLLEDWEIEGDVIGQIYSASPDIESYEAGFETPGVRFYASTDLYETDFTAEELLDIFELSEFCTESERVEESHELYGFAYEGVRDTWSDCGQMDGVAHVIAVRSMETPDGVDGHVLIMEYVGDTEADDEAVEVLLNSYFHDPATAEAWAAAEDAVEERGDENGDEREDESEAEADETEAEDGETAVEEPSDEAESDEAESADDLTAEETSEGVSSILAGIGGRRDEESNEGDESEEVESEEAEPEEAEPEEAETEEAETEEADEVEAESETSSAGDGVALALNLEEGNVYRLSTSTEQTVEQDIFGDQQTIEQFIQLDYAYTVRSIDADGNISVDVLYEAARFEQDGPTGSVRYDSATSDDVPPDAIGYAALVGSGFNIELAPSGEVLDIDGVDELMESMLDDIDLSGPEGQALRETLLSTFSEDALADSLAQGFDVYPDEPVAVGDSWSKEQSVNYGFAFVANVTYTLVDRADGLATIEMASTIESDPDAEPLDLGIMEVTLALGGEQSGTIVVDEATGWVVESTLMQNLDGSMSGEGIEVPMSMESTVTTVGSVE